MQTQLVIPKGASSSKKLKKIFYSTDPAKKKGTGEHEPILFTIRYGKGRVFHTGLGHGPEQLRCVGFIFTFQRGTQWAATGQVTQMEVPADFPADKISLR